MPPNTFRPTEVISLEHPEDTLEALLASHSVRSQAIYCATLLLLAIAVLLLPVVRVGVSVDAAGIVRPALEKQELRTAAAGIVESLHLANDVRVEAGELLLLLRSTPAESRSDLIEARMAESHLALADLKLMTAGGDSLRPETLRSRHRLEYLRYLNERDGASEEVDYAERERARLSALAMRDLVPRADLEAAELGLRRSRSELSSIDARYADSWRAARAAEHERLEDLRQESASLGQELRLLQLQAPLNGTLEQVASLSPGTYLPAGQRIGLISPDAALLAEVYVAPRDVGLIDERTSVRLQIDAFDHNDWGFLTGRVQSVSEDYVLVDERPMFRAQVALDSTVLRLRTGAEGELRKGMTLRARFMVAERTLWQLLRDDVSDWLDPTQQTL